MRITFRETVPIRPQVEYGTRGSELECFVPPGYKWRQLNFGQGEGQIRALGCEWGFYYRPKGEIGMTLHDGEIDIGDALKFVYAVRDRVFGDRASEVSPIVFEMDQDK